MKRLLLISLAFALGGCANISTETDYNTEVDFNGYQSWAWVTPTATASSAAYQQNGLQDQRIRAAVANQLGQQGLQQVELEQADLLVNYLTSVEKKVDIDTFYSDFGYHPYYYGNRRFHSSYTTETRVREYKEGTLVVDLIDAKSRQLIWRGSGTDTIKKGLTPAERTVAVQEAVLAILGQYPPQPEQQ
ncbi:DUF4136 domain-containing protein [Ferrimonas lipolytica]|uniref:DUF4136 domain-containing protein n=1 Tax=Ferrimonas lipolytica TaxID=2724191 RepID=A0A6H1UDK8_9GAMM|nr:DUF4136 domain-containing protein [Ferrimonas lipolytica]QIZ77161.1 DUF4136 domain-containing protein [Ferrimonas lipolytica]